MNALENLLIIAGISLDIFAAMECQGSLVAKIDKKQLVKLCALIAAWQMAALFVGSYLSGLLYRNTITHNEKVTGFVIAAAYTGYHLGFEHKTKAYIAGAILLWIAGIDVIVRHILR